MFCTSKNSKCQDLPKFEFGWGGGSVPVKTQSAKICLNLNGKGGILYQIPEQGVLANLSTKFALPLSGGLCITVVSHILRMWRLITRQADSVFSIITVLVWVLGRVFHNVSLRFISQSLRFDYFPGKQFNSSQSLSEHTVTFNIQPSV